MVGDPAGDAVADTRGDVAGKILSVASAMPVQLPDSATAAAFAFDAADAIRNIALCCDWPM